MLILRFSFDFSWHGILDSPRINVKEDTGSIPPLCFLLDSNDWTQPQRICDFCSYKRHTNIASRGKNIILLQLIEYVIIWGKSDQCYITPPVLSLACGDTRLSELGILILSLLVLLVSFFLISVSYAYILVAILRIPSAEGRRKAFSTCASHLTVVVIHYGCASFMYLRPKASYSLERDQLIAVTYTVATPLLNPIVYSLRNRAVQTALRNAFRGSLLGKG